MGAHTSTAKPMLGVLMLETRFPRPPGDIGNPASFAFPVRYRVVAGASPQRVVRERAAGLIEPFVAAAQALEREGCTAITTSCGFLALFQAEIGQALKVPFAASSLLQLPAIDAALPPGRRAGVITISAEALSVQHLRGAGAASSTPVVGVVPDGEFARAILGDAPQMDQAKLRSEVLEAGRRLLREHADVRAIVLECTNMPPYADALRAATGLPVYDVLTLVRGLMDRSIR
jgi:Asp/Glu/hydantoin racemase